MPITCYTGPNSQGGLLWVKSRSDAAGEETFAQLMEKYGAVNPAALQEQTWRDNNGGNLPTDRIGIEFLDGKLESLKSSTSDDVLSRSLSHMVGSIGPTPSITEDRLAVTAKHSHLSEKEIRSLAFKAHYLEEEVSRRDSDLSRMERSIKEIDPKGTELRDLQEAIAGRVQALEELTEAGRSL